MPGKAEILEAVTSQSGMTKAGAAQVFDAVVRYLQQAFRKRQRVVVPGLGTFSVAERKARTGVNPRTKAPIRIPAATTVRFKAGRELRDLLNRKKK
ncbi:MAG TPA: HU family DNA-binding protein [Thermoanaerobaculia bacterium]|nr:HU family DNA-binding protein [Thermoanaerobaculia bacterium]